MQTLMRVLFFLRIVDENSQLSLTWIAFCVGVFAIVYAVLHHQPVDLADLLTFAIGVGSYHAKLFRTASIQKQAMSGANDAAIAKLHAEKEVALEAARNDSTAVSQRLDAMESMIQKSGSEKLREDFQKLKRK